MGNPKGPILNWTEVGYSPLSTQETRKRLCKEEGNSLKIGWIGGGVLEESWVCLPGEGAAEPGRKLVGETRRKLGPTVGGRSEETTPRGAGGVYPATTVAAAGAAATTAAVAEEEEAKSHSQA